MRTTIDICMATYNGSDYLSDQIQSILVSIEHTAQIREIEPHLIFVDDGSTDGTVQLLHKLTKNFAIPVSIYVNASNQGHVRAFERALSYSKADYVLLSDQDDVWTIDHISNLLDHMKGRKSAIAFAGVQMFDNNCQTSPVIYPASANNMLKDLIALFAGRLPVWGCTSCMTRGFLTKCLPFPRAVEAHDIYLALCGVIFGEIILLNDLVVHRRIHVNNVTPRKRRSIPLIAKSRILMIYLLFYIKRHHLGITGR